MRSFCQNMEVEGEGPVKVLVIPPMLERNNEGFYRLLEASYRGQFTFYSIKPVPRRENGKVDYRLLLDKCREIIQAKGVEVLYANKHIGSFVLAILCEEFSHIRGPSVESIFLCNHKYYTTTDIDSREKKLPFLAVRFDAEEDKFDLAHRVLKQVCVPGIIRPCLGSGHAVYCYHNRDVLISTLVSSRKDVDHIVDMHCYLIEEYVDKKKYPLAAAPVLLINRFLDQCLAIRGTTWLHICAEACVYEREIIPWAIVDAVTLPYGSAEPTNFFPGFEMPTKLSDYQQSRMWLEFSRDINNLIEHGFNNSFVHAEYMVFEDGSVHLISIRGNLHAKCTNMYKKALWHGDNLRASLDMARGIRPPQPKAKTNYVLNYCMAVTESGKADNLIHFAKATRYPEVTLRYQQGQDVIIEPARDYTVIGHVTVAGTNFKECLEQIKSIRSAVIKLPELVPLTEG